MSNYNECGLLERKTLVENEGTMEMARARKDERTEKGSVNHEVILLV